MKVPWEGSRCIVCLEEGPLSEEHVIPRSLGGVLTCNFLCRGCNSWFGQDVEASAKSDPSVLLAAGELREDAPYLAMRLMEGQSLLPTGRGPRVSCYIRDGEFRVRSTKLQDGSLIQPTEEAAKAIEAMLRREGHGPAIIDDAVAAFERVPENQRTPIAPGLEVSKWSSEGLEPDLSRSKMLDPLLPVKTAFEFLALCVGQSIYNDDWPLSALRRILMRCCEWDDRILRVERLYTGSIRPLHGICNEDNSEFARVQIRLFGSLTYRVDFSFLNIGKQRYAYTHSLDTGDEDVRKI